MKNLENFLKIKKGKIVAWLTTLLVAVLVVVMVICFKLIQQRNSESMDNQIETGTRVEESDENVNQESNLNEYNVPSGDEEFDDSDYNEYVQLSSDSYEIDEDAHIVSFSTDANISGFRISDNPERPEEDDNWYDVEDNKPVEILDTDVHKKYVYYLGTTYYSVGSHKYSTLLDAYNAVSSGGTITVTADVTDDSTVTVSKSVTINTNGKTLKRKKKITNNSTLNITGSGKIITVSTNNNSVTYLIENTGTVNITGATLINYGRNSYAYGVIKSTAGNININNGAYLSTTLTSGQSCSEYATTVRLQGNTNVTVNSGGTIHTKGPTKDDDHHSNCIQAYGSSTSVPTGTVTIKGGTLYGESGLGVNINGDNKYDSQVSVNMISGTINSKLNGIYIGRAKNNSVNISGGNISSEEMYGINASEKSSTNVTITTSGTIESKNSSGAAAIKFNGSGKYTIGTSDNTVSTSAPRFKGRVRC